MKIFGVVLLLLTARAGYHDEPLKITYKKFNSENEEQALVEEDYDGIVDKDLINVHDMQLQTTLYLGSEKEKFTFYIDSGSDWLWVYGKGCINCPYNEPIFHYKKSETGMFDTTDIKYLQYGGGIVGGYRSKDQVCLTKDECSSDFKFLVVLDTNIQGMQGSGLLGLSPWKTHKGGDLFLKKMKEDKLLDEALFSLAIRPDDGSRITFGQYDLEKYGHKEDQLVWHDVLTDNTFWQIQGEQAVYIDSDSGQVNMQIEKPKFQFDTGASYTYIPEQDFINYMTNLKEDYGIKLEQEGGRWTFECPDEVYDQFPDFAFRFQKEDGVEEKWYLFGKTHFVERYYTFCKLQVFPTRSSYWILGINFLENFYSVFDQQNKQIGLIKIAPLEEEEKEL